MGFSFPKMCITSLIYENLCNGGYPVLLTYEYEYMYRSTRLDHYKVTLTASS